MSFNVVIPARYASSRLPGKPLEVIAGKPMVQHVYERAQESAAEEVIVATDDDRILRAVEQFGGRVVMTSANHESGTDRLQEVAALEGWADEQIVVGVQGDEPMIPPIVINQVAENLAARPEYSISTLQEKISELSDVMDPNVVKTAMDQSGAALYFSRAPIPHGRDCFPEKFPEGIDYYRHIGIYGYRVKFLRQFASWEMSPLEKAEKLEQLRAMWYGAKIHLDVAVETPPKGVDTPEDLEHIRRLMGQS